MSVEWFTGVGKGVMLLPKWKRLIAIRSKPPTVSMNEINGKINGGPNPAGNTIKIMKSKN